MWYNVGGNYANQIAAIATVTILIAAVFFSRLSFCTFPPIVSFSAAAKILFCYRSSVQLPVCDSFLNYGYFSLSFVKERNLIPAHWRE